MIISASRRTDIPAFYGEWFLNRLEAGTVLVRNPMNHRQISRVSLTPEIVDCIVFWSKDPLPFLFRLPSLEKMGYRYYFQFTLTPYRGELEKNLRPKEEILQTFQELSRRIGPKRTLWRYDPIILNKELTICYHREQFQRLCEALEGFTERCTISFVDLYAKLKKQYRESLLRTIEADEKTELCQLFSQIASQHGLTLYACSEEGDFSHVGVYPSSCIHRETIETICGYSIGGKPDRNQRAFCRCFESIDIGAYNSCPHGCLYCYANYSGASVAKNCATHDPKKEILIGEISGTISERPCHSLRISSDQLSLFDPF